MPSDVPFTLSLIPGFVGRPHITVWARPLLRGAIRDTVKRSGCELEEGFSWWNRKMVILGTVEQINEFIRVAWENDDLRKSLKVFSEGYDDDQH